MRTILPLDKLYTKVKNNNAVLNIPDVFAVLKRYEKIFALYMFTNPIDIYFLVSPLSVSFDMYHSCSMLVPTSIVFSFWYILHKLGTLPTMLTIK